MASSPTAAPTQPPAPAAPADPLVTYYRNVRQMNMQRAPVARVP